MENHIETKCIQREFGHCVINWEIENFGFAAHGMKYDLKSSCFTLRPQMTTWRMVLTTELGLCDDTQMLFCLERMDGDAGPDVVCANIDISILDQDRKVWKGCREKHKFRERDSCRVNVPNIYFGKVNVGLYNFNVMTLRCRMIVYEIKDVRKYEVSINSGLKDLAADIGKLYEDRKYNNVALKCNNGSKQIEAHKAILAARSKALKDIFSRDAFPVFNCLSLQCDEIEEVLRYIYRGNIEHVLDKPSISIYDCVSFFSIDELEDHYIADEQKMKSTIDIHQTGLMWTIENFDKKADEYMLSRMISCNFVEMTWQLRLYPRGIGGKDEFLAIIAENMEGKIDGDVWAKVELFHDPYDRSWKSMRAIKESELFELRDFAERKSVFEKLEDGALRICFKVCASTGETHSSGHQFVNPIPRFSYDSYYEKLSKDISSLRGDTSHTDVVLIVQGKKFEAHKCILSVRSSFFSDLSDDLNEDKIVYIEDIRPNIIEIVLDYIYSGVLKESELDIIFEVYEAAGWLGVKCLVERAAEALRYNLNVNNARKIFLSACAQGDAMLQKEVLKFLKKTNVSICNEAKKLVRKANSKPWGGSSCSKIEVASMETL